MLSVIRSDWSSIVSPNDQSLEASTNMIPTFWSEKISKDFGKMISTFWLLLKQSRPQKLLWSLTTSSPVTTSSAIVSQLFLEICLFFSPPWVSSNPPTDGTPYILRLSLSSLCSFLQCNSKTMFLDRNEAPCFLGRLEDLPAHRQNIIQTSKRLHDGRYIWYMLNIGHRVAQYLLAPSGALAFIRV